MVGPKTEKEREPAEMSLVRGMQRKQSIGRRTKHASRSVDLKTVREIDRCRVVDALVAEGINFIFDSL